MWQAIFFLALVYFVWKVVAGLRHSPVREQQSARVDELPSPRGESNNDNFAFTVETTPSEQPKQRISDEEKAYQDVKGLDWKKPSGNKTRQPRICTIRLSYCDAEGVETQRDIALYKSGATNTHFGAWCALRQDRRTFAFSRIVSAIDLETGEVIKPSDVFQRVHPDRKIPWNLR